MIQLLGAPIAEQIRTQLRHAVSKSPFLSSSNTYVAIIYCGNNKESATYIRMKKKFAQSIGIQLKVFGQDPEIRTAEELIALVMTLAHDDNCIGFMPQLPLPDGLKEIQYNLFDHIPRYKDIDGLGSQFMGKYITQQLDILGATPQAVFRILDFYDLGSLTGKKVTIIGQSNLLGKPLILECMRRNASVISLNKDSSVDFIRHACLSSDFVISCTGAVHLLNKNNFRTDSSQIVVDVGRGLYDGKATGDVNFDGIDGLLAYTPVPGGVGPVTIASLLSNAIYLSHKSKE